MKKLSVVVIIFIMLFNSSTVFATPLVKYQGELNYPPFNDLNHGVPRGFDVDLTNLIFKETDYTVDYSMGNWSEVYKNLVDKKIDTVGLLALNPIRKEEILYSNVVMQWNVGIYTRSGFKKISLDSLKDLNVAVGKDQYTEKILSDKVGIKNYKTFLNIQEEIRALESGEVDAVFENQEVVNYLLTKTDLNGVIKPQVTNLFPVDIVYSVSKDRPELVTYINERLKDIEKSGVYEELYQKYFFTHSKIYNENKMNQYLSFALIGIIIIIILIFIIQRYIKFLRKRIMIVNKELVNQYEQLETVHEELAITEEELRAQYDQALKSEEIARLSEERFRLAFEGANDGLWDCDLTNGTLLYSEKCNELLGSNNKNLDKNIKYFEKLIHPDYMELYNFNANRHLKHETSYFSVELKMKTRTRGYVWMLVRGKAIFNKSGIPIRMAGSLTDISQRKQHEEIIYKMAYYDSLTEIPNRILLESKLNEAINEAKVSNEDLAVMFLDLDNFKSFNDNFGHAFGDKLLIKIAQLLEGVVSEPSIVARIGGDEFIVMLRSISSQEEVKRIAEEIIKAIQQLLIIDNKEIYITTSIGIALYPKDGTDVTSLLSNADTAMYYSKGIGKNTLQFHNYLMSDIIAEKLKLEHDLRQAVKENQFLVFYQPKVDVNSRKITGMEALVRWFKPGVGIIAPNKFIPLAEETGLIVPIGLEVLKIACTQNARWQEAGYPPIRVAVNLSVCQFQQRNLVEIITEVLYNTGLKPCYLELEITESIAMNDFEYTIEVINKLKVMGIHISLDDFGTGYSSLSYLKNLPINTLKIDKSFVDDITVSLNGKDISKALVMMAHSFNLTVVAEGVETEEQFQLLKEQGCDVVQGYLFSKPVCFEEFEKMLIKL
ncbi:MAG: EAL domain-containing protein [Clostridiaceae bacterium]|nr:EAL domain-containing protein [Clostridiaceae bacterium]